MRTHMQVYPHIHTALVHTYAAPNSTPYGHTVVLHRDAQMPTIPPNLPTVGLRWLPNGGVFLSVRCSHVRRGALCRGWGGAVSKLAGALCGRRGLRVEDPRWRGEADLLGHPVVSI